VVAIFFSTFQKVPMTHPVLRINGTFLFVEGERQERGLPLRPPSRIGFKERVELYISPPLGIL
jgi:hypothetical protein